MSTVRAIARLAGVSATTVSRALRDHPYVRPEIKARVLELAKQFHYRPNRLTQSLFTGKTNTLGCILPSVTNTFFSRLQRGILTQAVAEGYRVITLESQSDPAQTRQAIHTLVELRVDGLLIASEQVEPISHESMLEMRGHDIIPISLDATPLADPADAIGTDEAQLASLAVEYLMNLGHRQIAFVGVAQREHMARRAQAMRRVLRARGLSDDLVINVSVEKIETMGEQPFLGWLLKSYPPPTAIFTWEDRVAARLLQQAHRLGIRVPKELSVLGCSNMEFAELLTPPLTTIEQYPEEMGKLAVQRVLECIAEPDLDHPGRLTVPATLVERGSCGAPSFRG
ncbi:MAG: LacI family DNA-binding transcriptional regulator [Armatimonadota bacterium]